MKIAKEWLHAQVPINEYNDIKRRYEQLKARARLKNWADLLLPATKEYLTKLEQGAEISNVTPEMPATVPPISKTVKIKEAGGQASSTEAATEELKPAGIEDSELYKRQCHILKLKRDKELEKD